MVFKIMLQVVYVCIFSLFHVVTGLAATNILLSSGALKGYIMDEKGIITESDHPLLQAIEYKFTEVPINVNMQSQLRQFQRREPMDKVSEMASKGFFNMSLSLMDPRNTRDPEFHFQGEIQIFVASANFEYFLVNQTYQDVTDDDMMGQQRFWFVPKKMIELSPMNLKLSTAALKHLVTAFQETHLPQRRQILVEFYKQYGTHLFLKHTLGGYFDIVTAFKAPRRHQYEQQARDFIHRYASAQLDASPLPTIPAYVNEPSVYSVIKQIGGAASPSFSQWYDSLQNSDSWKSIDKNNAMSVWGFVFHHHRQDFQSTQEEFNEFVSHMQQVYWNVFYSMTLQHPERVQVNDENIQLEEADARLTSMIQYKHIVYEKDTCLNYVKHRMDIAGRLNSTMTQKITSHAKYTMLRDAYIPTLISNTELHHRAEIIRKEVLMEAYKCGPRIRFVVSVVHSCLKDYINEQAEEWLDSLVARIRNL